MTIDRDKLAVAIVNAFTSIGYTEYLTWESWVLNDNKGYTVPNPQKLAWQDSLTIDGTYDLGAVVDKIIAELGGGALVTELAPYSPERPARA